MSRRSEEHIMGNLQTERNFGQELLHEIRERRLLHVLTNRFDYSEIQRLKRADRTETLAIFQGTEYAIIQALKSKAPKEVVDMFQQAEETRANISPIFMIGF